MAAAGRLRICKKFLQAVTIKKNPCYFLHQWSAARVPINSSAIGGVFETVQAEGHHVPVAALLKNNPRYSLYHSQTRLFVNSSVSCDSSETLLKDSHCIPTTCFLCRGYAKKAKKDKGGKSSKKKVDLTSEELEGILDMDMVEKEMQLVLEELKQQYIHQLTLRTSAGVFDSLMVNTDDGTFPLVQLAQIVQKNPQLILIYLGPTPQYIPAVKEAISNSGLNVNPQQDGNTIFVPIPKVTKEHRENLAKSAKMLCDKAKVKLRDIHGKHVKKVRSGKDNHSEDLIRSVQEMILNKMHLISEQADKMMHSKQQDLVGGK